MTATFKLSLVVLAGLVLGVGLRHSFTEQPDRVVSALALFETVCVPIAKRGDRNASPDLSDLEPIGVRKSWADPESVFVLSLTANRCAISDILLGLDPAEQERFAVLATALVASEFPMLARDERLSRSGGDGLQVWSQFDVNDRRRWGVWLFHASAEESSPGKFFDTSTTMLSVSITEKPVY